MGGDISREISFLRTGNVTQKRRSARRLHDLASDETTKDCVVTEGGIGPLVELLKSRDRECRSNAVYAIAFLANDAKYHSAIIEEGGLSALVRLLAYGGHQEKACAAQALGVICAGDRNAKETVRAEGGIPMLIRLLKSPNKMSAHHAVMALARISIASPDTVLVSFLTSEGGIAPLIELLRRQEEVPRMWATIVISHVAGDEESQREIINEGGIKYLVCQLRSPNDDSRLNAANSLFSLCEHNLQTQDEIVLENGVQDLVSMLKDQVDVCREQAALVLNILSKHEKHYIEVIDSGVILPALRLLDSPCQFCRESASYLLVNLSCKGEGCHAIMSHDGIEKMLHLVETQDEITRLNAVLTLANLGQSEVSRQLSIMRRVAFPC